MDCVRLNGNQYHGIEHENYGLTRKEHGNMMTSMVSTLICSQTTVFTINSMKSILVKGSFR